MLTLFLALMFVCVVAAAVFTLWVTITGVRAVWRLIAGPPPVSQPATADAGPRCQNNGCGTINPAQARFCRRCGSAMGMPASSPVRRPPMRAAV